MANTGRSASRRLLVQAMYQYQITNHDEKVLRDQYGNGREAVRADKPFFEELLTEMMESLDSMDERLSSWADRPVDQIDPIEHAVLWLGVTELQYHPDVPTKVIINEAVELCKLFGAQDGHRYVNALLDKAAKDLRPES
ncbi:MAG: transcription antitermination factor NusB [Gammaproteobacteria bacterium]|nr:transcription antitermination factor NusB [Gammaproteobacteria bacterium]